MVNMWMLVMFAFPFAILGFVGLYGAYKVIKDIGL